MYTTPLFSHWRPIWEATGKVKALLRHCDELAEQRNELTYEVSTLSVTPRIADECYLFLLLCRDEQTDGTATLEKNAKMLADCFTWLEPVICPSLTPRWIDLEVSLSLASEIGDLLLSALVMRNLIEELFLHQKVIEIRQTVVQIREGSNLSAEEFYRFRQRCYEVSSYVLPRFRGWEHLERQRDLRRRRFTEGMEPNLVDVYSQLGDYVHPNYGSHLLFVKPYDNLAGIVVGRAFKTIYERLFRSELPMSTPVRSQTQQQFGLGMDLAGLARELNDPVFGSLEYFQQPEVKVQLNEALEAITDYVEVEKEFEGLSSLAVEDAAMGAKVSSALIPLIDAFDRSGVHHDLGSVLSADSSVNWPVALGSPDLRCLWACLIAAPVAGLEEDAMMMGEEQSQDDYSRWFPFILNAVTLTMTVTEQKIHRLVDNAVRLLCKGSVLGAAICVRSVLEHHAALLDTGWNVEEKWKQAQKDAYHGKDGLTRLSELEGYVARFLAGTMATQERQTVWRSRWMSLPGKYGKYNVMEAVRAADLEKRYDALSMFVHGELYRGGELIFSDAASLRASTIKTLVIILGGFVRRFASIGRTAALTVVAVRLSESLTCKSTTAAEINRNLKLERLPEKFKVNRDLKGQGQADDPYVFRSTLMYHEALHSWCALENIVISKIEFWRKDGSNGDRVVAEDGRVLYFLNEPFHNRHE